MPVGRPTEYNEEILKKARQYLDELPKDEVIHSIEGLACFLGISRETVRKWGLDEDKAEFVGIVEEVLQKQAKKLANSGLQGTFNSSITKLLLSKHGYAEKTETDITSKGEKIEGINYIIPNGNNDSSNS